MSNYFTHIEECTVFAWQKAIGGDLTHLRLKDNGTPKEDATAWDSVYNSYITEFGLGKEYIYLLEVQRELAEVQLDYVIENDRILLNRINVLKADIKTILDKEQDGNDMTTTLIVVSKWLGYKVDQKNTTILQLYKILDLIKKENENKKD